MEFGFAIHSTTSDPKRPVWEQVDETGELIEFIAGLGTFTRVTAQHHWLSYPTVWPEPMPMIARWLPFSSNLRFQTSIMKLAIHNPVEMAHQVATLDHICHGRFDFGIGIGYQREELEAVGATRKQRASRLEESLTLMKQLWTGEEVHFEGKYWRLEKAQMGYTCLQKPHPPIFNASYSEAATRRAAKMCDAVLVAPQASWTAIGQHAKIYRDALAEFGKSRGRLGVNRQMCPAKDTETALVIAREEMASHTDSYDRWEMREPSTIDMVLEADRDPRDWAIAGSAQDCVEQLKRHKETYGIDFMNFGFFNLPRENSARKEFLQRVSEDVLAKVNW